jgi:hypothetical protein
MPIIPANLPRIGPIPKVPPLPTLPKAVTRVVPTVKISAPKWHL